MAWIDMVPDDKATGALKEYYEKYGSPTKGIDNILKIHSLDPESLRLHYDYYKHLMSNPGGLSRMQREMIAVVVSATNGCHY